MTPQRRFRAAAVFFALVVACRPDKPARTDSATAVAQKPPSLTPVAPGTGWNSATNGPVLLAAVPENLAAALIVLPDVVDSTAASSITANTSSFSGLDVELFDRSGLAGATAISTSEAASETEGCLSWPRARLLDAPSRPWSVGFVRGAVVPIHLDSLEAMSQADSAAVTREVARLSSLAAEGEDPTFAGLPFIVRRVYRFTVGANSALVADVVRKISEEANPREEHILLVAERDNSSTGYVNVFHARVAGSEETVRTNEIVAAVRFVKGGTNALVIAFEYEGGGRIALLERTGNRTWKIRWRSAYTGC